MVDSTYYSYAIGINSLLLNIISDDQECNSDFYQSSIYSENHETFRTDRSFFFLVKDPVLFCGSLRFNLDPSASHTDEKIWEALEMANLKSYVEEISADEGLLMSISEGGGNLRLVLICSFGEWWLITFANKKRQLSDENVKLQKRLVFDDGQCRGTFQRQQNRVNRPRISIYKNETGITLCAPVCKYCFENYLSSPALNYLKVYSIFKRSNINSGCLLAAFENGLKKC